VQGTWDIEKEIAGNGAQGIVLHGRIKLTRLFL